MAATFGAGDSVYNDDGDRIVDSLNIQFTRDIPEDTASTTIEFNHVSTEHDRILAINGDTNSEILTLDSRDTAPFEVAPGTAFVGDRLVSVGDRIYVGYDHGADGNSYAVVMAAGEDDTYRIISSTSGPSSVPPDSLRIATVSSVDGDTITFETETDVRGLTQQNRVYFDPAVQRFPENAPPRMVPYFTISSEKFDKVVCVMCKRTDRVMYARVLMPDYDIVDGMMKPIEDFSKAVATSICNDCQKDHPVHEVKDGTCVLQSMKDWGETCQTKKEKEHEERSKVQGAGGEISSVGSRLSEGQAESGQASVGSGGSGSLSS